MRIKRKREKIKKGRGLVVIGDCFWGEAPWGRASRAKERALEKFERFKFYSRIYWRQGEKIFHKKWLIVK
jgi:hypothetical protein